MFKPLPTSVFDELLSLVATNEASETKQFKAVKFMLLANQISWQDLQNQRAIITSEIPIGSGLGSSASFAICVAAFFLLVAHKIGAEVSGWTRTDLDSINSHALQLERIFHGTASGIDNTVGTFGRYIVYQQGELTPVASALELPVLVVSSGMPKSTMEQVGKVRRLCAQYPEVWHSG